MLNREIANIFNTFADIYEIMADELAAGGDKQVKFKIRAYRQGALTLENLSEDLKAITLDPNAKLSDLPGIGNAMAHKIEEYIQTGKIKEFEAIKKLVAPGLISMLEIPGLGPKKVKLFYTELGIKDIPQLKKAILDGKIENLPRMGKKSADKILEAIERFADRPKRFLLGSAVPEAEAIIEELKSSNLIDQISFAGSARRQQITVGDLDIICSTKFENSKIIDFFKSLRLIDEIIAEGDTKISVYLKSGIQLDLRVVKPNEFGAAIQYFTGSKAHNVKLRTIAKSHGFKINEYGIFKGEKRVGGAKESDIYEALKMETPPPEIRENTGEIEAAQEHKTPKLIELKDIKGDLHIHSTYSDGKHSISEIITAATKLGYEYIAITDHSPSLGIAHGLDVKTLAIKKAEIEKLQKANPQIKVLYGTEVDILADGSLDYPDNVLKEFDLVIASIHSRLGQDNTERIIKAMENPYVHIIGHPSTRQLNQRDPSPNNWTAIYQAAARTKTILELNATPLRLDLEGQMAREAKTYGCKFIINTDTHNLDNLNFMRFGVGQARKGWLNKNDVINTAPYEKFLKQLK